MSDNQQHIVNFVVGGRYYSINLEDIRKYPGSYFNTVIKKEWHENPLEPVIIDRNGELFQYIVVFHVYGELPLAKNCLANSLVRAIQVEADLTELVDECYDFASKQFQVFPTLPSEATCTYYAENKNDLVHVLSSVWAEFSIVSVWNVPNESQLPLFNTSTLGTLNISELLTEAVPTQKLDDQDSVLSFEIPASKLDQITLRNFTPQCFDSTEFAPYIHLEIKPHKLVIYPEGGHFTEHRDSVRGDGHIGTLVYILDSEFTGGKFVVRQNKEEVYASEPHEWIAMYTDCPRYMERVTSGHCVMLEFDVYHSGVAEFMPGLIPQHYCHDSGVCNSRRGYNLDARQPIYAALDKELEVFTDVVICLDHRYPSIHTTVDEVTGNLTGSDELLYTVLSESGAYELSLVLISFTLSSSYHKRYPKEIRGGVVDTEFGRGETHTGRTKLIFTTYLDAKENIQCRKYKRIKNVGKNSGNNETTYVASGLRITKKVLSSVSTVSSERVIGVDESEDPVLKSARIL